MKTKRFLAMLLVLAMVLSLVPATAWAEDEPKAEAGTIGVTGDDNPDDGIELDKVLTADDQGNYTLNLEAYVTGETSTVTQRTPTDITIIMDVSGSMGFSDMGIRDSYDYAPYSGNLAAAYAAELADQQFYHVTSSGDRHEVDLVYIPKCNGTLYKGTSSGYSSQGTLSGNDLYGYTCNDSSCNGGTGRYAYGVSFNSQSYYLTRYATVSPGTGSSSYFPDDWQIYWYSNELSRMESMQSAVTTFIESIDAANQKDGVYYAESLQHRIGLVKFSGHLFQGYSVGNNFYQTVRNTSTGAESYYASANYGYNSDGSRFYNENMTQILLGSADSNDNVTGSSVYVNSGTLNTLKNVISSLHEGGATQAHNGLALSSLVLDYNESSAPGRKQVVLFFTDGEPTTKIQFEAAVANNAISAANDLKQAGATVYAINISPADSPSADMLQYMYRVSSNYEGATSTSTGTEVSDKYYKAVANAQELADLFEDIQQEIPGAAVELTDRADLRDYLADGVLLTDDTVITASVVPYRGNGTWGTPEPMVTLTGSQTTNTANGITLTVDRETGLISATGFNYKENFVEDNVNGAANTYRGAKLLVTIQGINITEGAPVSPDGFIFTNKPESGVYTSTTSSRPADIFPMPYVTAANDNLYLDKKAGYTSDGTVTIDLEAFATGKTYSYQARKPVDITIVMDLSTSMVGNDWGTRSTADWDQYNYNCEAIPNFLNKGAKFAHMTPTGEIHEVEIVRLTSFSGKASVAQTAYSSSFSLSSQNVYAYQCPHDECKVSYTSNGTEYLGYPYRIQNTAGTATYDVTEYYNFSASSTDAHFFPESLRVFYTTDKISRIAGMKKAVNDFIAATAEANEGVEASQQHRIALVKFASNYFPNKKEGNDFYTNFSGNYSGLDNYLYTSESGKLCYVNICGRHIHEVTNSSGSSTRLRLSADTNCAQILSYAQNVTGVKGTELQSLVNSMVASGVTMSHYGMLLAKDVVATNKAESGREQIVLFFTDGKPESGDSSIDDGFNEDYANSAITYAKDLKDAGAKVYTISLMKEDDETADMKTFMQHASSNYPNATSLTEPGADGNEEKGYHLLASSTEDLNEIFDTITKTVNDSEINLTAAATLRDYLAKGVELTEDSVITVHTVPYAGKDANGDRQWGTATEVQKFTCSNGQNTNTESDITVSADMTTGAVFVTGFDYESNYVGADENGNPKGQKLKVTITKVKVTEEAEINENGMIYTNKPESGVYPSDNETDEPAGLFLPPQVPDLLHTTHLDKKAELTDNGTYTITLDAYSTGQILNTQERNPVDITILMDVSNSMNSYSYREGETLLSTMQDAISNFLEAIAASNQGCELSKQHRVGMAKFANTASKVFDISYVNESTLDSMLTEVNNLTASGNTRTDLGATEAQTLIDNASPKLDRPQILILFSDGQPTPKQAWNGSENDGGLATCNRALTTSAALKAQEVTVYSIALIAPDLKASERYRMNEFMDRFSSNYPDATSMSDPRDSVIGKYFKSAEQAEELTSIFADLTSQYVPSSATDLNGDAQLRDYLAEGFVLTDNTTVTVQSVAYEGNNNWSDEATTLKVWSASGTTGSDSNIAIEVNRETNFVGVSGFDYGANKVTEASYDENGNQTAAPQGKKLVVTITGIEATDEAIAAAKKTDDGFVPTNNGNSGLYPSTGEGDAIENFPIPEVKLTSKIYVLDYAKEASLAANDWQASQTNHLDADGMNFFESVSNMIDEKYGMAQRKMVDSRYDNKNLYYTPQTMLWDGYDSFYSFGKQEDEVTNLWSKISVLPANSVYYEDTFVTSQDSGTVGIVYTGSWTEANTGSNTEDENGNVHGWITDLGDDTGFSDGSAHMGYIESNEEMATAVFKFTGTGVDIYTRTNLDSGVVTGALIKCDDSGNPVQMVKMLVVDNLAVSGDYYQIPTLSFNGLEYGTYQVNLGVRRAAAVDENGQTVKDEEGNTQYRATYYLDGIRVYNPLNDNNGNTDKTVQEAYGSEFSAIFQEVRDGLLDANSFDSANLDDINGYVFIDLTGALDGENDDAVLTNLMGTYEDYGPKNEVYLANQQGISFKVDTSDPNARFFLGIKAPDVGVNTNSSVEFSFGDAKATRNITHTADLYYEVKPNANGYIFIKNTGTSLISITKLRSTGNSTGMTAASAEPMAAYINSFRSLPVVEYTLEPLPPAAPAPEPTLWEILAQIQSMINDLYSSLTGWFN